MKFGVPELLIILAVVVIVLGPTQIPKLTKMFGKSVKSFKEGLGDDGESQKSESTESSDGSGSGKEDN